MKTDPTEGDPHRCPVCQYEIQLDSSWPASDFACPRCGHLLWFSPLERLAALDIVAPGAVIRALLARNKRDAIAELVERLHQVGHIQAEEREAVVQAVLRREELGSTGVGRGVAIPHARPACLGQLLCAVGYSPAGIDFESLDSRPVHTIVLVLSPAQEPGKHLKALERVSRILRG